MTRRMFAYFVEFLARASSARLSKSKPSGSSTPTLAHVQIEETNDPALPAGKLFEDSKLSTLARTYRVGTPRRQLVRTNRWPLALNHDASLAARDAIRAASAASSPLSVASMQLHPSRLLLRSKPGVHPWRSGNFATGRCSLRGHSSRYGRIACQISSEMNGMNGCSIRSIRSKHVDEDIARRRLTLAACLERILGQVRCTSHRTRAR